MLCHGLWLLESATKPHATLVVEVVEVVKVIEGLGARSKFVLVVIRMRFPWVI